MIQEYLLPSVEFFDKVASYCPQKVSKELFQVENTSCWILSFSVPKENEESARVLSAINDYVVGKFQPVVLTNESSAYFNRRLFPYFNEFERKLRKLLYLSSAVSPNDNSAKNIQDLEAKDFGDIFSLLFTDSDFITEVKTGINKTKWPQSKAEILLHIESIPENTLWDQLLGKTSLKDLGSKFSSIRKYRNDVMHAHNMDSKSFDIAMRLLKETNEKIDREIGRIVGRVEVSQDTPVVASFNETLSGAIQAENLYNEYLDSQKYAQLLAMQQGLFAEKLAIEKLAEEIKTQGSSPLKRRIEEMAKNITETGLHQSIVTKQDMEKLLLEIAKRTHEINGEN